MKFLKYPNVGQTHIPTIMLVDCLTIGFLDDWILGWPDWCFFSTHQYLHWMIGLLVQHLLENVRPIFTKILPFSTIIPIRIIGYCNHHPQYIPIQYIYIYICPITWYIHVQSCTYIPNSIYHIHFLYLYTMYTCYIYVYNRIYTYNMYVDWIVLK